MARRSLPYEGFLAIDEDHLALIAFARNALVYKGPKLDNSTIFKRLRYHVTAAA